VFVAFLRRPCLLVAIVIAAVFLGIAPPSHQHAAAQAPIQPITTPTPTTPPRLLPLIVRSSSSPITLPPATDTPTTTIPTTPPEPLPPPTTATNVLWVAPNGTDAAARGGEAAPLRTLAFACSQAQAGQTIRLTAGEFRETAQCVLRSGVRVMGSGARGAARTLIYAPASWNFTADGVEDNPDGYVIRATKVQSVTVDQIAFGGNDHRANGAVLVADAQGVTLRDLEIVDFRYTGLHVRSSAQVEVLSIALENSGYEWPPRTSTKFPDGGSVGNLGVHDVRDSTFGFITIKTTDLHGYGVKASNLSRVRFHNLDCDMHPFQSWMGPGPNNFDMEIHGGYAELVEIAHSRFRQTISLMGGNDPRYAKVPYSIHVHHNLFDMKNGSYSVEVGTDKMVFDHNWFRNTWTALQNYGDATTRIGDLTVFNNVVENLSMRFVGLKGRAENLRVFGNTVYLSEGGGQSYLVTLGKNNASRHWLLANNVIVGAPSNPASSRQLATVYEASTAPRQVQARNNVYRDITLGITADAPIDPAQWGHQYTANLLADPGLPLTGTNAFQPPADSPVIDRGDPNIGVRTTFIGAGRDVGAFEGGATPWRAGLGTSAELEYVWAPTTSVSQEFFVGSVDVDLSAALGAEIRYTLDGSEPGPTSARYNGPIRVTTAVQLRARAFKNGYGSPTALTLDLTEGVRGYPNLGAQGSFSASSTYPERASDGTELYSPAKAFDGITYSWVGWTHAADDRRPWLQVDLKQAARIRYVELYTRAGFDDPAARRNFEIRASNDPTFATSVVLAAQGTTALPREGVFEAEVANTGTYRYIRAAKTADEGFFVTELRVLGQR
jgi:hypothetical protein